MLRLITVGAMCALMLLAVPLGISQMQFSGLGSSQTMKAPQEAPPTTSVKQPIGLVSIDRFAHLPVSHVEATKEPVNADAHKQLQQSLTHLNIEVIPSPKVHLFLKQMAQEAKQGYAWAPLREVDVKNHERRGQWPHSENLNTSAVPAYGKFVATRYDKAVPQEAMKIVEELSNYNPTMVCYVGHIADVSDPFLAVGVRGHPMFIVAWWDEPGFNVPLKKRPTVQLLASLK